MTDRATIAALAVVTSTRPGALSILDATPPSGQEHRAQYWAEPSKIAEAIALLEELGFTIIASNRMGVSVSAWQETFETAFQVKLAQQPPKGGGRAVWRATPAGGGTAHVSIPPVTEAQKGCLRGLLLEKPAEDYVDVPINTAPQVVDRYKQGLTPAHAYWIMPHQLRRQLSLVWRPDAALNAIPRGRGAKVVVVDSGWRADHAYWDAVNLGVAARNVTLVRDSGYAAARAVVQSTLERMIQDFYEATHYINELRTVDPRDGATPEVRRLAVVSTCGRAAGSFALAYDKFPQLGLKASRAALDNPVDSDAALDGLIANLQAQLREAVKAALEDLQAMPAVAPADSDRPHGTGVVGHLIAVAPEADVTVVQCMKPDDLPPVLRKYSAYTGLSLNDGLVAAARLRPNILSCSKGDAGTFEAPVDTEDAIACAASLRMVHEVLQILAAHNGIAVFCAGNNYPDQFEPPNVLAQTRIQRSNLIVVGGAWWSAPGATAGDPRTLSASSYAVGYWEKRTGIRVPHICGLVGPEKQAGGGDYWGICFTPLTLRDGRQAMPPISGTSFATPEVAGVAAVVVGLAGNIGPSEVRRILIQNMAPIRSNGSNFQTPFWAASALDPAAPGDRPGLADLYASAEAAKSTAVDNARASIVAAMEKAAAK